MKWSNLTLALAGQKEWWSRWRWEHEFRLLRLFLAELIDKRSLFVDGSTVSGCGSSCWFHDTTFGLDWVDIGWLITNSVHKWNGEMTVTIMALLVFLFAYTYLMYGSKFWLLLCLRDTLYVCCCLSIGMTYKFNWGHNIIYLCTIMHLCMCSCHN